MCSDFEIRGQKVHIKAGSLKLQDTAVARKFVHLLYCGVKLWRITITYGCSH